MFKGGFNLLQFKLLITALVVKFLFNFPLICPSLYKFIFLNFSVHDLFL